MNQHGPRRSGILETVQAIPTSTTPTVRVSARGEPSANSMNNNLKPPEPVNNTKGTNSSSVVNDNAVTNNVTVVQNATNKLQNLATYSLDPPNSFSRPTRIPAIDTISAAWPTPMGSIDNEMDDVGNPPSMQPITNEINSMSNNEKIPNIDEISDVARIPLDFQEEPAWERSHASAADVTVSHATYGHAMSSFSHTSRHFVPTLSRNRKKLLLVKSRKIISTHARRRENVAAHPRAVSRIWKTNLKVRKFKRKEKFLTRANSSLKHKNSQNAAKRNKKGKKRVTIPPPKPIDPIQPLLETFEKEKEVGDIKEHTMDIEAVKPNEGIDKHLISLKSQPKIKPITEHISKEKPADIESIQSHQLVENVK